MHLDNSETGEDRTLSNVEGDIGCCVNKRMFTNPSVCTDRKLGFGESNLYRDLRMWQSGYSECEGDMADEVSQIPNDNKQCGTTKQGEGTGTLMEVKKKCSEV